MRFMTLVKSVERREPMPQALIDAVMKGSEAAKQGGTLLETGRLAPTARSVRVRLANGKVSVVDGPYAEGKEVIGGFGLVEAASQEEAVEGAVWLMNLHRDYWPGWEGEVEVRPITGPEDLPRADAG